MTNPAPARRRRRWWKVIVALALLLAAGFAALPWALGTPTARRWLLARANRALSPGGLEVSAFRFSWFGPTILTDFAIRDPQGDRVVVARRAVWDRSLGRILFDRPRFGTLWLDGATGDIERLPDGTIDLYEALRPILGPNPRLDLTVRVRNGRLRFRSPGLAHPVTADPVDLTIRRPPRPGPLHWEATLAQGTQADAPRLTIEGDYNNWLAPGSTEPDLAIDLDGRRWPIDLAIAGQSARGRFEGTVGVRRHPGGWSTTGKTRWEGLDIAGPALAGDHLRLDRLSGEWRAGLSSRGWTVDRLDVESALGSLRSTSAADGPTRIVGTIDLAEIARQVPHALRLRDDLKIERGSADLRLVSSNEGGRPAWDAEARVSDLSVRDRDRSMTLREPATLRARLVGGRSDFAVRNASLETAFLTLRGEGDVDHGVNLTGSIDLAALARQAGDLIDLGGLELEGRGPIVADYRRDGPDRFSGNLTLDLDHPRVSPPDGPDLRRDALHLIANIRGASYPSGLPRDWGEARVEVDSGEFRGQMQALADHGRLATATADLALGLSAAEPTKPSREVVARVRARRDGDAWAIDQAMLRLRKDGDDEPIGGVATGRFDPASGELILRPAPDRPPSPALALAPEGITVLGLKRDGGGLRAEGGFEGDVSALEAAVSGWLDRPPTGLVGAWSARAEVQGGDGLQFGGRVEVRDLPRADGPIRLDLRGAYRGEDHRIDLAEVVLSSRYARLEASGPLTDLGGTPTADLRGRLAPTWDAINATLRERFEPEARIEGRPGEFRVRGPLVAEEPGRWPLGLDARIGFELTGADLYGMRMGPATIAATVEDGELAVEPIETTLNEGKLRLRPEVAREEGGAVLLRLAPGSDVENAAINDEVSRRVLAYAAPILGDASQVRGRVSARIDRAEVPIAADAGRKAIVEGRVVFQDVVFIPGPLGRGLLQLINRGDPTLALDRPVVLSIADGRVRETGLEIPVGRLTRIGMEGTIGFDRSLDLVASIPLRPGMIPEGSLLGDVLEGTRVRVPISGTLADPKVDREAFRLGMRGMGKDLLERGAAMGAARLLERLAQPRDPNAPPRMTPQERRALRQQKRAQRRMNREP